MIILWKLSIFFILLHKSKAYQSYQNPSDGEFGLVDENNPNKPCLYFKFNAKIYNFNLNNTNIAFEVNYIFEYINFCS